MNHLGTSAIKTSVTPILIAAIGVAFALWFYWTPIMDDDLHYMLYFRDFLINGGDYRLSDVWQLITTEWHTNNIRWVNMITAVTHTVVPKWMMSAILGLCTSLILKWTIDLAGAKGKPLASIAVIAMVVCCLPWHANLGIMDYALNYVVTSAIILLYLKLWLYPSNKSSRGAYAWLSIIGLLAGSSHEGFALPVMCGMAVYAAANIGKIKSRQIILAITFLIGLLIQLSAEGKTSRAVPDWSRSLAQWIHTLVFFSPMFSLMCVIIVTCWIKAGRGFIKHVIHTPLLFYIATSIATFVMSGMLFINCRASWVGELSAIIIITLLFNTYLKWEGKTATVTKRVAAIGVVVFLACHLITVDVYARRCNIDYQNIIATYRRNPDATIYYDYTRSADVPLLALGKVVSAYPWIGEYPLTLFRDFYCPGRETPMVIPSRLCDFTYQSATKIPGRNPMYMYKGAIIAPRDTVAFGARYVFHFKVPVKRASGVVTIPFVNNAGDSLDLCAAWIIDRLPDINPIVKIDRE